MRYYLLILIMLFVLAASPTLPSVAAQQQKPTTDEVVQYLLSSAAEDFHDHGPAAQLRFRDVRVGRNKKGDEIYRMCGQFQKTGGDGKTEWLYFATVKTSGYEQYVGGQTISFCKDVKWDTEDLSSSLQGK